MSTVPAVPVPVMPVEVEFTNVDEPCVIVWFATSEAALAFQARLQAVMDEDR